MKARFKLIVSIFLLIVINSCDSNDNLMILEGKVFRGPINPVEIMGVDNNAPFSALFHVYDESKKKLMTSFTSNSDGKYQVMLVPDNYVIIPDVTAPIIRPTSQVKSITVKLGDTSISDLYFDTGIR